MTDFANRLVERYGEILTIAEAADLLKMSRTTIWRLRRDGVLRSVMNGKRIETASVAEMMESTAPKIRTRPKTTRSQWQIK